MKSTQYLLIGGGVASSQAAKQLRRDDPGASITLVGGEPCLPYDRPPLSKEYLQGKKPRAELFYDPESYFTEQRIEIILAMTVDSLDLAGKTATLSDGRTIRFEKVLIATGGRPVRLPIPGHDLPGVHYLRTLDDADSIAADAASGRRAVIIGAGFIGMELAASLTQRGVQVTVVETGTHIWPRFADAALAGTVQRYCEGKGVRFRTQDQATAIVGTDKVASVKMKSGQDLVCHFICIGVGIVPNVELARQAGLTVDNGVVVDEYLRASHPDVFAAGDIANYVDPLFATRRRVEHWGHAEYTGQLAAQNMAGGAQPYDLLTYVWSDIFDLHLEFAGDESEHDQVLTRGRLEDRAFTILYLKDHRLRAYFAINANAKEFPPLQRLIRSKKDLTGKEAQLQDPAVNLKSI